MERLINRLTQYYLDKEGHYYELIIQMSVFAVLYLTHLRIARSVEVFHTADDKDVCRHRHAEFRDLWLMAEKWPNRYVLAQSTNCGTCIVYVIRIIFGRKYSIIKVRVKVKGQNGVVFRLLLYIWSYFE